MEQSFVGPEQRLSQISIDLLKRMAEIRKLRELIKAAEGCGLSHSQSTIALSITTPPGADELRA
jgi:hypothetical protein